MPIVLRPQPGAAIAMATSVLLTVLAAPVAAHTGHVDDVIHGGLAAGFLHPFDGWDHLLAMFAVGLWAASIGGGAVRLLIALFPLAMLGGAAVAMAGVGVPAVEAGIALSAVVLGLAIASALRPATWVAASLVALFAVFHGHAHGTELPADVDAFAYAGGFLSATVLLHLAGAAAGALARRGRAGVVARLTGVAVAAGGFWFLQGA